MPSCIQVGSEQIDVPVHEEDPDAEERPSAHALQAEAPIVEEYMPNGQLLQVMEPVESEYLPTTH